jgi:hypothetical protein
MPTAAREPASKPVRKPPARPLWLAALATALATAAAAAVLAASAAWPLRTEVAVRLKGGLEPTVAGHEPAPAGPQLGLRWVVALEPPLAEEPPPAIAPAAKETASA